MAKVLFVHIGDSSWENNDKEIISKNFELLDMPLQKKGYLKTLMSSLNLIVRCDVAYYWFGSITFLPVMLLMKILGKKNIVVAGGYDVGKVGRLKHGSFDKGIVYRTLARLVFMLADRVLCVSKANWNEAVQNAKVSVQKMHLVPLGFSELDRNINPYKNRLDTITMISHLDSKRFIIKGGDQFCKLAQMMPDYEFQIIGEITPEVKLSIEEKKISNLKLLGPMTFDSELFNKTLFESKFIAQLSYYESFGAALVDGAIRGCYPIASKQFALEELVSEIGIGFDYGDLEGAVKKIEDFKEDKVDAKEVSSYFAKKYSLSKRECLIIDFIKQITV